MTADTRSGARDELVAALLRHDLESFAATLEIADGPEPLPTSTAVRLLNFAEELSRSEREADKNQCLLICGMLWEHRRSEWAALPQFVMNLLSRIGLAPSMQMVDADFKASGSRYQPLGSIAVEAAIEARNVEHEVLVLGRTPLVLSSFQRDVWQAIETRTRVGISAPTSAGKSFVLLYKALDILGREAGPVVYVVPTLSLIQQVTRDFRSAARQLAMSDVDVLQSYLGADDKRGSKIVYVVTQERALAALAQDDAFRDASLVIVDEVQNVERAADENEERAHTLFDVLLDIVGSRNPRRAVISGPRVENIAQLTRQFFGPDATAISQGLPPVVNVTYAFTKVGAEVSVRQYAPGREVPLEMPVRYPADVAKSLFGKKQYRPPVMDFIAQMLRQIAPSEGTLVFSPTSVQATKTAVALAERGRWGTSTRGADALVQYVEETVHSKYALQSCLVSGVAFHHGKMPNHVRAAVEQAFASFDVRVLACTTTLMQGVNLPAKNIVARNPNLFVKQHAGRSASLTAYEFANLRGRAGRLLKDFVGRAIILDETAFDQQELDFDFPEKYVIAGYAERFERNREDIVGSLRREEDSAAAGGNADLVVYVRQTVLRFGSGALTRLAAAGIDLTDDEYAVTRQHVERLAVPRAVCARAPYWDPVSLDALYVADASGRIPRVPSNPRTTGFSEQLFDVLLTLQEVVPYYYDKYVGESNLATLRSTLSMAQRWASEVPLKEIITWAGDDGRVTWEDIDRRLTRVNQNVMYDVPKLLKPLVAIQATDNPILGMIEMGAYRPEIRRMIELGVPRETAVRIGRARGFPAAEAFNDEQLLAAARVVAKQLNYWEQEQLDSLR